jgi:hypothetical protein
MSFFAVVGFFALANRDVPGAFSFFDTTIVCGGNVAPVPVDLRHFRGADDAPIADDAVALVTAKAYSPSQTATEDFMLDTVDIDVFGGDPRSTSYEEHVPAARPPNVFANSTVSDCAHASEDSIATFLIGVSEFVRNGRKQSVILCVLSSWSLCFPLISSHRCRLDKASPRWRNVPPPAHGAQISVIGPIYDILLNGRVVINIVSVAFSSSNALTYPPQLSAPDVPDGKRRKLQARAPRRPQTQPSDATNRGNAAEGSSSGSSSTVLGAVGTQDEVEYVSPLTPFYCRIQRIVTIKDSQLRHSRLTSSRTF